MDEFEFPCSKCGEPLISNEETAGTEAVCPYCDQLIVMPVAPPVAENSHLPSRRHDGTPMPTAEPETTQADQGANRDPGSAPTHLPSGRKRQEREDFGRLAAMAGGRQIDPMATASSGGMVSFHCPGCARLIWIRPKDAGMVVACSGCSLEVICPSSGKEARLVHSSKLESHHRQSAIPARRSNDQRSAEHISASLEPAHKPTALPSGPNRPGRTLTESGPAQSPKTKVNPIPKQRDVEISPSELTRYRAASRERKIQKATTPIEEFRSSPATAATGDKGGTLPPSRRQSSGGRAGTGATGGGTKLPAAGGSESGAGGHRLSPELMPSLEAREDVNQITGEPADPWGANAEQPARGGRRLVVLGLVLVFSALATAGFFAFRNQENTPSSPASEETQDDSIGEYEASKALLERFLAASTIDERLPLVRHPEETRGRMEIHEQQEHSSLPAVVDFQWPESGWINEKKFIWIDVRFNDGNPRTAVFEITPEGPKLDWESFVFFAIPLMSDFVSRQPEQPAVYRVICTIDHYYNRLYDDEEKYLCFHLKGPDGVSSCWGYADVNSDIGWKMSQLFNQARQARSNAANSPEDGAESIKVMLKLHFEKDAEGKSNSQAWIDEIVSDSWVIP